MKRAVLILLVVLTACQRPVDEPIRVTLAPGLEMTLPELHPTDGEIVAVQTITGTWKGQNFALQAHLVAMGTSLDLIALDPLGRRTMTIEWPFRSNLLAEQCSARRVLRRRYCF